MPNKLEFSAGLGYRAAWDYDFQKGLSFNDSCKVDNRWGKKKIYWHIRFFFYWLGLFLFSSEFFSLYGWGCIYVCICCFLWQFDLVLSHKIQKALFLIFYPDVDSLPFRKDYSSGCMMFNLHIKRYLWIAPEKFNIAAEAPDINTRLWAQTYNDAIMYQ